MEKHTMFIDGRTVSRRYQFSQINLQITAKTSTEFFLKLNQVFLKLKEKGKVQYQKRIDKWVGRVLEFFCQI